ncbi:hypothetical protein MRX96_031795 [Rhipicephalus microplus]
MMMRTTMMKSTVVTTSTRPPNGPVIAVSIATKVTFKRQAMRPGKQNDLARNRQLHFEATRARRYLAATQLDSDMTVVTVRWP